MSQYEQETSMRRVDEEGVEELLWVTSDRGAFGSKKDGPLYDWISCKEHFMSQVKDFDTVIQAGGNCGMYARFYANYFRNVITFEPDPLNFYCLDRNCVGPQYTKYQGGLGNTTENLSLQRVSMRNVGMHKIKNLPGDIRMYRLDDMNIERCDLLHLDIEGYEEYALRGATQMIERLRPVIITERSSGEKYLFELGYRLYRKMPWDTVYVFDK